MTNVNHHLCPSGRVVVVFLCEVDTAVAAEDLELEPVVVASIGTSGGLNRSIGLFQPSRAGAEVAASFS